MLSDITVGTRRTLLKNPENLKKSQIFFSFRSHKSIQNATRCWFSPDINSLWTIFTFLLLLINDFMAILNFIKVLYHKKNVLSMANINKLWRSQENFSPVYRFLPPVKHHMLCLRMKINTILSKKLNIFYIILIKRTYTTCKNILSCVIIVCIL